jgi:zinc protease
MRFQISAIVLLAACSSTTESRSEAPHAQGRTEKAAGAAAKPAASSIPFQKFVLDNGLELVVHEDHANPVVAVYLYYHVGSAREVQGRSGFAHLFEHMLFQGSEHVGDDQHFKLVQAAGGTLNGSTTSDRTNYFEVLPANQLELALWLESDRMGFLLPAMTQAKLDNQRDVVKNERRQNYENRPYGQADGVIAAALYPPAHPYSWLTIGSQEDLSAASLDDVKGFFRRWYGPNNATLAVGGDVKADEVVALVRKYFGSLPRGPEVETPAPRPTKLVAEKRLLMEDKVKLPELSFTWPTVPARAADEAALDVLAGVLASNNASILDKALKMDEQLASEVSASHRGRDLAGEFTVTVRANAETTLDALEAKTRALLEKLAKDGVSQDQLERVKTRYETGTIRRQETVQQRTSTLANSNCFTKDPGFLDEDIRRHLAVTPADVKAVLERYVLGKPAVVLSVVPDGKKEMAAARSSADGKDLPAAVEYAWKDPRDRKIEPASSRPLAGGETAFDRTQKPAPGASIAFHAPKIWHAKLPDGVDVVGSRYAGIPMTTLTLTVPGGRLRETMDTLGLSSMTAELLQQGTRSKTATAFLEELDRLGASLSVSADEEEINLSLSCLDKHLAESVRLLSEVILHPRFADEDFQRVRKERLVAIDRRADQIRVVAGNAYRRLLWGDGVAGMPTDGTHATVEKLSADAVRGFWKEHGVPSGARLVYVGGASEEEVQKLFAPLAAEWKGGGRLGAGRGPGAADDRRDEALPRRQARRRAVRDPHRPRVARLDGPRLLPADGAQLPARRPVFLPHQHEPARGQGLHLRRAVGARRRPDPRSVHRERRREDGRHRGVRRRVHEGAAEDQGGDHGRRARVREGLDLPERDAPVGVDARPRGDPRQRQPLRLARRLHGAAPRPALRLHGRGHEAAGGEADPARRDGRPRRRRQEADRGEAPAGGSRGADRARRRRSSRGLGGPEGPERPRVLADRDTLNAIDTREPRPGGARVRRFSLG